MKYSKALVTVSSMNSINTHNEGSTMSQAHRNTMLTILALRKIAGPSHGESTYLIKYLRAQLREA